MNETEFDGWTNWLLYWCDILISSWSHLFSFISIFLSFFWSCFIIFTWSHFFSAFSLFALMFDLSHLFKPIFINCPYVWLISFSSIALMFVLSHLFKPLSVISAFSFNIITSYHGHFTHSCYSPLYSFHINYKKLSLITTMIWRSPSPHLWYPVLTKDILDVLRITHQSFELRINRSNYTSIDRDSHQSIELRINRSNYASIDRITHQSIELQCTLRGTWSTYYGTALCLLIVSWDHDEIKISHQYNNQLVHPSNSVSFIKFQLPELRSIVYTLHC